MPVFRCGARMLYYAHIPKCGGSSLEQYLITRLQHIGFYDSKTSVTPVSARWSRTSPQHIDWASLQKLLPEAFFDEVFAVVRHPVSRVISAYHFQVEIERTVSPETSFPDWLRETTEAFEADSFIIDNHFRPQVDFIPAECRIFHLEHGLDAVIPYLDDFLGDSDGPRFIGHTNNRADAGRRKMTPKVIPGDKDLALIERIYAADFSRFGYEVGRALPTVVKPDLSPEFLAASAADRARTTRPLNRLASRVRRRLGY